MFCPYTLLLVTVYFWVSYAWLLVKWPRTWNKSISRHAAGSKQAYVFFLPAQAIGAVTYLLFMIYWMVPVLHVSNLFILVYSLALSLYAVAVFLPDTQRGKKAQVHLFFANCFAIGLGLSSVVLLFSSTTHDVSKVVAACVALYQVAAGVLIASKNGHPERLRNYLLIQSLYIAATHVLLLTLAFSHH